MLSNSTYTTLGISLSNPSDSSLFHTFFQTLSNTYSKLFYKSHILDIHILSNDSAHLTTLAAITALYLTKGTYGSL